MKKRRADLSDEEIGEICFKDTECIGCIIAVDGNPLAGCLQLNSNHELPESFINEEIEIQEGNK